MSERIQNVHEKWYKGIKYKSTLEAEAAEALDKMGLPISTYTIPALHFDKFFINLVINGLQ